MRQIKCCFLLISLFTYQFVSAQADQFHAGKAIPEFGKIAEVEGMEALPANTQFKVSFDVAKPAKAGGVNRSIDSVARFINMHHAVGVKGEDIQLAVVVHGGAVKDMTKAQNNKNAALIVELQKHGVNFYVCGQSATYYGVKSIDLLPGVNMSLSAMTAHALLQQEGFTVNPF